MLTKIEYDLKFVKKRDYNITTPCCHKSNRDGKFVNYKNLPKQYGYCHSCGETSLPPARYVDEKGNTYVWDEQQQKVIQDCDTLSNACVTKRHTLTENAPNTTIKQQNLSYKPPKISNIIDFDMVELSYKSDDINNFKLYLHRKYVGYDVTNALQMYYIGTSANNYTVFWYINQYGKVQKSKEVLYQPNGKRTNKFRVPYKNDDEHYFCLFGEHLLANNTKPIILVESEKTAVICSFVFPKFTWLAYSGINGLTYDKLYALRSKEIIIIPDLSRNAVDVIKKKQKDFDYIDINAKIYDLTEGKTDEELKQMQVYNDDLEDILRSELKKAHHK
jgi:hypothetical protein